MKKTIILSTLLCLVLSCQSEPSVEELIEVAQNYEVIAAAQEPDLEHIQRKIYQAFVHQIVNNDNSQLKSIEQSLQDQYEKNENNLILYWRSYLNFYQAIAYLQQEDKDKAEKVIDQAVEWLDEMPKKNSEDYALLAMVQSFSIQFKAGIKAPFISKKVKKNAQLAMKMDAQNLRAYYVYGSSDYYTPEQYGGGKEVEEYLKKAISLPDQTIENTYLPSWGKEDAYLLLIKFYMRKEQWDDAKQYFKEANQAYPNSYQINQLAAKLIDK